MLRAINGDPEEDLELLSDCSDSESESESGSSSSSDTESVKGFLTSSEDSQIRDSNLACLDANKEKFDDDEPTLSCTSSSVSKTLQLDSTVNEEDSDDFDLVKDKMENLNILSVKNKSNMIEKLANSEPQCSKETQDLIKKNLSGKKNPMLCSICGEYMDGELGLKIHISRKHRNN